MVTRLLELVVLQLLEASTSEHGFWVSLNLREPLQTLHFLPLLLDIFPSRHTLLQAILLVALQAVLQVILEEFFS